MLWREAVRLDWRLFWRSLQQSSGAAWVVLAGALIVLATMGESSYQLGVELRSNLTARELAQPAVAGHFFGAFIAAFAFVLATGELPAQRLLLADLAIRPVPRRDAFLALQAVSAFGRHVWALLSFGLPLLILLGTWLSGVDLVAAIVAAFVLMRLPVAVLTIGSRLASTSTVTAVTAVLAMVSVVVVFWLVAPRLLITSLPPLLVARIVTEPGSAAGAWAGLAAWTLVLAAIEFLSMSLEPAPVPSPIAAPQLHKPVPAAIRISGELFGCSPVLLHGELLRLSRWRRHQFSWLLGIVLIVMLGTQLGPSLVRIVILVLLPVHVGGSTLANLFAADRAAFQAFVLAPLGMDAVIRAKVTATLLFTMVAEAAVIAFLVAGAVTAPALVVGVVLAAGLFAWTAAVGLITSTLFPSATDLQSIGGSLVTNSAFVMIAMAGALYIGAAVGLAFLVDSGRSSLEVCALAAVGLVSLACVALVAASRISMRLVNVRLEAIIAALTTGTGSRT